MSSGPTSSPIKVSGDKTRNIGIIAHIDAGKTTTTERMLYYSGITKQIGDVDKGDTVTDYLPAEKERGITIVSAAITFPWKNNKINLIDTPGHADFTFEVVRSIRVLDGAVTILDAVAGVEAQTEKVWSQAKQMGIPRLAFVNKMDRDGAGFGRTVREIVAKLDTRVAIVNMPYFEVNKATNEPEFTGVIDVIDKQVLQWPSTGTGEKNDGKDVIVTPIAESSEQVQRECEQARTALIETLTELDETLVEEFFDEEGANGDYMSFESNKIKKSLRACTIDQTIVPVLCGASFRNIGVQPLLEAVVDYLPSPAERPPARAISRAVQLKGRKSARSGASLKAPQKEVSIAYDAKDNLTCALAFKVVHDRLRGTLVYVRVYSGTLYNGSVVVNTSTGRKERVTKLMQMQADMPIEIAKVERGNIGVILGSDDIKTGDTLVGHSLRKDGVNMLSPHQAGLHLHPIDVPPPVFFASITPLGVSDQRQMDEALAILLREDPSLHLSYDEDSGQTLLSGMGELHLEIAKDRLVHDLKARVKIGPIMISYRETLTSPTSRITQAHGTEEGNKSADVSAATVTLSVEPVTVPDDDFIDFTDRYTEKIHQDRHFIEFPEYMEHQFVGQDDIWNAVRVGVAPALARPGKRAHLPLHSVCVKVDSVELSEESTSASSVATAVRLAVQAALEAVPEQNYALMEPVMDVKVVVNEEDIGQVVNDMSGARKGSIVSLGEDHEHEVETTSGSDCVNYKQLAKSIYVPLDHTMYMSKHGARTTSHQSVVHAHVPLRKMVGYLTSLRSMTQGRGTFLMSFYQYEQAAADAERDIIDDLT